MEVNDSENGNKQATKKRKTGKKDEPAKTTSNRPQGVSRTLRACDLCRKQKTRCFKSTENTNSCLRCQFVGKVCSFSTSSSAAIPGISDAGFDATPSNPTVEKLNQIQEGVNEILVLMKKGNYQGDILGDSKLLYEAANSFKKTSMPGTPSGNYLDFIHMKPPNSSNNAVFGNSVVNQGGGLDSDQDKSYQDDTDTQFLFQTPIESQKISPFAFISNQIDRDLIPKPIMNLMNLSTVKPGAQKDPIDEFSEDIMSLGILTDTETVDLMNDFRRNYGRWVSFPSDLSTGVLVDRIRRKSPLLLSTCCCLSLRYALNSVNPGDIDNLRRKKKTYKLLAKQLTMDLNRSILKYSLFRGADDDSGAIEFLQALVILSIYSLSLSSVVSCANTVTEITDDPSDAYLSNLNFDPWFLSGIGLMVFTSKSVLGTLFGSKENFHSETTLNQDSEHPFTILFKESDSDEYQTLTILRIYNHFILVHLINCVFSGRMCLIDEIRLNYCTSTLSLPSATNFDGRMVSEIGILLITYNFIQVNMNSSSSNNIRECETNFNLVKEEIRQWYEQWEYLFSQPALQFVEFCYFFCCLVTHYSYHYKKFVISNKNKQNGNKVMENSKYLDESNIDLILSSCDQEGLLNLFKYSYQVIKVINVTKSDSYFAYLSDQVHFCFYFSGIFLIKILKYLKLTNQLKILDNVQSAYFDLHGSTYPDIVKDLEELIQKLGRIGQQNEEDILYGYKVGLQTLLESSLLNDEVT